ncbi:TetR/AcrR family transcriptional regulator [Rhodococcus aerolatus]
MRSASDRPPGPGDVPPADAVDRIRDAALELFAAHGVRATSVRAVAERAGVSPPLVIHHYGSKDALRTACDRHLAATVRARKRTTLTGGADPLVHLRAPGGPPLMAYLARTVADGTPEVAALVDELVDDAEAYLAEGVLAGTVLPSEDPRGRAVVLTLWSLGSLALGGHVARLTGVDLTADPTTLGPWAVPAAEVLSRGVLPEDTYRQVRDGYRALDPGATP